MPEINMMILVRGKDSYRVRRKIKETVDYFKNNKNFVVFLDGKDGIEKIKSEISQDSFFKEKKLIILENCWFLVEKNKEFLLLLEKIADSKKTTLVFKEENTDKRTESFFKKNGKIFDFEPLDSQSLIEWIRKEVDRKEGKMGEKAINKLIAFMGNDLWAISNEIDKLTAYKKGELIKEKDVDFLTCPKIEGDIFKAIDFLAAKNKRQALDIFYKHIKKGDHALYLITMITFQFRNLLLAKKSGQFNAKDLEMHPFVFQKSIKQARFFSEKELEEIYEKILEAEVNIKTGKTTPEAALDLLIAKI